LTAEHRANLSAAHQRSDKQHERGPEYYQTLKLIEKAIKGRGPKAALQRLLQSRLSRKAREAVEIAIHRLPGPMPHRRSKSVHRGPETRVDLDAIREENLSTEEIAARYHVGVRWARRQRAK